MTKYLANVNKLGCKTIVVEADSEEEAYENLCETWGEKNVISEPELPQSEAHLESIECKWGID